MSKKFMLGVLGVLVVLGMLAMWQPFSIGECGGDHHYAACGKRL